MFTWGFWTKIFSPLLLQGVEIYKNIKDNRVIQDLQRKIKILRILVGSLTAIILLLMAWMIWH
jgi:hypothetical protein